MSGGYQRSQGAQGDGVRMFAPGTAPCKRCGRRIEINTKAKRPGVCKDCRYSDPDFVDAIFQPPTWIRPSTLNGAPRRMVG